MIPHVYDGTLLDVTGQGAAIDGAWYAPQGCGDATHLTLNAELSAGTATWVLEGRNSPNEPAVQVDTGTASKGEIVARFRQYRMRLTAATGATFRASLNAVLKPVA